MVATIANSPDRFPLIELGTEPARIRELLDEGIAHIREVARILAVLHGTPDLGNKANPVDELIYIILSRRTREDAYEAAFTTLKERFATWEELLDSNPANVQKLVRPAGLETKRVATIYAALTRLKDEFGSCTLAPALAWDDEELTAFLRSLPELEKKSAHCVMMFSMGRTVFPVDTHVGRVLKRIGIYRALGLDLDGHDHKKLQRELEDLVPPALRYSLHVNLVEHGRKTCTARNPSCEDCEIRNFCRTYRAERQAAAARSEAYTAIDLFCGAGGLSEGFERAGIRTVGAVDSNEVAMKTFWLNHPSVPDENIVTGDLEQFEPGAFSRLAGDTQLDILVGAPPCQGFSSAGKRSKRSKEKYREADDSRNFLFEHLIQAAEELKPRVVLLENVPGMNSARSGALTFLQHARTALEELGYTTAFWKVNAAAFGVPQDRQRVFLIAALGPSLPARPAQEYQSMTGNIDVDALPPVTLDEAIFDLPPTEPDSATVVTPKQLSATESDHRYRRYVRKQRLLDNRKLLYNHCVRYHNDRDLELYAMLKPGQNSVDVVEQGRDDLMRYRTDVFDDKYTRLRPDRPCKTIVAHLAKDGNGYIHPDQVRSISVREAARVQSFPDGYIFCGAPTDQWTQLGNAVPPVLGEAIARSILRFLRRQDRK